MTCLSWLQYAISSPISSRVTSLALQLGQSSDCPSANEVTLKDMGKIGPCSYLTHNKEGTVDVILAMDCILWLHWPAKTVPNFELLSSGYNHIISFPSCQHVCLTLQIFQMQCCEVKIGLLLCFCIDSLLHFFFDLCIRIWILLQSIFNFIPPHDVYRVYPIRYAHSFVVPCFGVVCNGFLWFIYLGSSLALRQK